MEQLCSNPDASKVLEVFQKFDADGSWSLDKGELADVLLRITGGSISIDTIDALMNAMDRNGDGTVSYGEFLQWAFHDGTSVTMAGDAMQRIASSLESVTKNEVVRSEFYKVSTSESATEFIVAEKMPAKLMDCKEVTDAMGVEALAFLESDLSSLPTAFCMFSEALRVWLASDPACLDLWASHFRSVEPPVDESSFRRMPDAFKTNPDFLLQTVSNCPSVLRLTPAEVLENSDLHKRLIMKAITGAPKGLPHRVLWLPDSSPFWSDTEVLKAVFTKCDPYSFIQEASVELQSNRDVVLAVVSTQYLGRALKFASEELRADREVVLAAVIQGFPLKDAAKELQEDERLKQEEADCCQRQKDAGVDHDEC